MYNIFKSLVATIICNFFLIFSYAGEGMWIPSLINKFNVSDMQSKGMKISAEEIYSVNNSSLNDAIVKFGGGCTGEIISDQGLLLTNHHCGFSRIQSHSSVEQDYLKNGFWAKNKTDELKNPNLTATFILALEDVTKRVLSGINNSEGDRESLIKKNINQIINQESTNFKEVKVKPFDYGNSYFMLVTKTYKDVRLVGAPPSSIGKFGRDTDNWVWPRHTGDFSIFRIYANENNQPAEYNKSNKPYQPEKHLKISTADKHEGDFTMIYGFPASTEQHLVSDHVKYIMETENPAKIKMREKSLEVIDAAMAEDDETRIMYASIQSGISNAYKKWIGQNAGLKKINAVALKKREEQKFITKAKENDSLAHYAVLVDQLKNLNLQNTQAQLARALFIEYIYYGPKFIRFTNKFEDLVMTYESMSEEERQENIATLKKSTKSHFKNHKVSIDRKILKQITPVFDTSLAERFLPKLIKNNSVSELTEQTFEDSYMTNKEDLLDLLDSSPKKIVKKLKDDPAYKLMRQLYNLYRSKIALGMYKYNKKFEGLMKKYSKAQKVLYPDQRHWLDANFTLRLSYGQITGSDPRDGIHYEPYTTMAGIIEKNETGKSEYQVPKKLTTLYENEDFGSYDQNGEMWVCFLASNHTSGGNSGSPVLDANGYLTGLNFDRSWESTMSDIIYDPEICRNISVDIRYVLWVIDKFAGATHLVEEMDLVQKKNSSGKRKIKIAQPEDVQKVKKKKIKLKRDK